MAHTKYHTNWVAEKIIVEIDRNQSFKNGLEVKKNCHSGYNFEL